MNNDDLKDFSMLGLFLMEAENQFQSLNDGLIKLEKDPEHFHDFESLMRASHSLKGGAQIVQSEIIVKFAHSMEDYFVDVMNGKIAVEGNHIDLLLEGADLVKKIAEIKEEDFYNFVSEYSENFRLLTENYQAFKIPQSTLLPSATQTTTPATPEKQQIPQTIEHPRKSPAAKDNFVKVASSKMQKLLGLAGESFVSLKSLHNIEEEILKLKKNFIEISEMNEKLYDAFTEGKPEENPGELVSGLREKHDGFYWAISEFATKFSDFSLNAETFSDDLYNEVVSCEILPFEDLSKVFPRTVRDIARKLGKHVNIEISGDKIGVDREILEKLEAPLNHLIRNAIDHGIETPEERKKAGKPEAGNLKLSAFHWEGMFNLTITDDGAGIDLETVKQKIIDRGLASDKMVEKMPKNEILEFLFLPGFSTSSSVTEISGRGVGLDVVLNMVQEVKGTIKVDTELQKGTTFHLRMPTTLSVISVLIVEIANELYAFPTTRIDRLITAKTSELQTLENHQFIRHDNVNTGVVSAREILGYPVNGWDEDMVSLLVISDRHNQYALAVDRFIKEDKIVIKPIDERLGKIPCISAVSVLNNGSPVLVTDIDDIVRSINTLVKGDTLHKIAFDENNLNIKKRKRVLVIDDSITVRELEKHLLENKGYLVETAVDGMDGWNAIRTQNYDIVITDIDMPKMNGFELVEKIKSNNKLRSLPVMIVSYKDREEDRVRGIDAGADYYLTKSSFHDNTLIDAVFKLIGGSGENSNS